MSNILEISSLTKRFGGVVAIDNFSVTLEAGKIHGLIGPNGAGKTTIFNNITGIYTPTSGIIKLDGADITGIKPFQAAQKGIGRTFQNIRLFNQLTVLENVIIASNIEIGYKLYDALFRSRLYRREEKRVRDNAKELLEIMGLKNNENAIASSLPYGHQRKLEIARALALGPKLLLLDEPAAGMNAEESKELVAFVATIKKRFNLTILMIEHHMEVVSGLCDKVTVLNFGKSIAEGTVSEVKKEKCVLEAYLGVED